MDHPSSPFTVLCQRAPLKYAFILEQQPYFPVNLLCKTLAVAKSAYYHWLKEPRSKVALRNAPLNQRIVEIFDDSRGTYGAPRVHQRLLQEGVQCSIGTVKRLMKLQGIKAVAKNRPRYPNAVRQEEPVTNVLAQQPATKECNHTWVGDITYLQAQEGWLYLAAILDLHSRKIIGWALDTQANGSLVISALEMAVRQRGAVPQIFHSDKGSQYTSTAFRTFAEQQGIQVSNSGTGNCYDNAVMERFFKTLKEECTNRYDTLPREQLKSLVFEFIEVFYNRQRIHSALGYQTPTEFEAMQNTS